MSKNVAVFVDVANLYYSARSQEVDVDYVALLKAATKGRDLIRAYAYSGLDPENENQRKFIDFLGKNGYKVIHKDIRKFGDGRVKANLDIELVVDLFRLADRMDIAVIVSGDGDFAPAIRALQDKGVRCEVISFRPNTSSDLMAVADEFIDVMKIINIGRAEKAAEKAAEAEKAGEVAAASGRGARASRSMSAPEMPAKEVVPEFGFREAPPSVAAAALAALRGGGGEGAREGREPRGRGRGRGRPRAEATEAPASPEVVAVGPGTDEATSDAARRRRRRRGGRGRGRGRGRGEGMTADTAAETAIVTTPAETEIGWTEFDDISQVGAVEDELSEIAGLGDEREIGFEEADAATLAELGISPEPEVAAPAARRTRTRKPVTVTEPAGESEAEPAPKPKRSRAAATGTRTGRSRKPAVTTASTPSETDAAPAAAPKRRSRSRVSSAAVGDGAEAANQEGSGDAPAEGIWQRFRSGRAESTRPGAKKRSS